MIVPSDLIVASMLAILVIVVLYTNPSKLGECENNTDSLIITKQMETIYNMYESPPLSVRQNNPINIKRYKVNKWLGSNYKEGIFEAFESPRMGIRASIIVIKANMEATNSVEAFVRRIVTKEGKNYLFRYMKHLELKLGYKGKIKEEDNIKVLKAMIYLEGGVEAVEYFSKYLECR